MSDQALDQPLPGALGVSMQKTVDRLRASIQNREELQNQLGHQALHDHLTGLPNRKHFIERLGAALRDVRTDGVGIGLLFVDLDGFKNANDLYGHEFGYELLKACASRIEGQLSDGDVAVRLGGDEFVVLTRNANVSDAATKLAEKIVSALQAPIPVGTNSATIGASIGIAIDLDGANDERSLLRKADTAMYQAKSNVKGSVIMFDPAVWRVETSSTGNPSHRVDSIAAP